MKFIACKTAASVKITQYQKFPWIVFSDIILYLHLITNLSDDLVYKLYYNIMQYKYDNIISNQNYLIFNQIALNINLRYLIYAIFNMRIE